MKLKLNIIFGITAAAIALILLSLAQEMNRRWQIQREVQQLEQEVLALDQGVTQLENLNQYFQTEDYQERLAREKLNYRAEGEQVVLIPEEDNSREDVRTRRVAEEEVSLPILWWNAFFEEREI